MRRVTVEDVHVRHTLPFTAPAAPADFAISGTQILIHRSSVSGQGVWPVVTQAGVTGPNVILNFKTDGAGIAPHQRWATGLLVDSSEFSGGTDQRPNIAFSNCEYAGSGHGWSVGWAVAWNVKADYLLIQQPPGSKNWCIGCTGRPRAFSGTATRSRRRRCHRRPSSRRASRSARQASISPSCETGSDRVRSQTLDTRNRIAGGSTAEGSTLKVRRFRRCWRWRWRWRAPGTPSKPAAPRVVGRARSSRQRTAATRATAAPECRAS